MRNANLKIKPKPTKKLNEIYEMLSEIFNKRKKIRNLKKENKRRNFLNDKKKNKL